MNQPDLTQKFILRGKYSILSVKEVAEEMANHGRRAKGPNA